MESQSHKEDTEILLKEIESLNDQLTTVQSQLDRATTDLTTKKLLITSLNQEMDELKRHLDDQSSQSCSDFDQQKQEIQNR